MSLSGIQKITLLSCLVLSMALFLPKLFSSAVKDKEVLHSEAGGPGRLHGRGPSSGEDQGTPESLYTTRPKPRSFPQKAKLLGRVAPLYGFAIFLYIIYIFGQFSHRDPRTAQRRSFSITTPEHTDQDLQEDEMSELKTRIKQMDGQQERRTSKSFQNPARCHKYRDGHLRKMTYMLVEEHPLEDVTPEVEAEETPYSADWEGYPEETFPWYMVPLHRCRYPSVILEEPYGDVPTPEELAERIHREEEEDEKSEEETEEVKAEATEDIDGPKGKSEDGELELEKGEEMDDDEDNADEVDYTESEEEEEDHEDQGRLVHNSTDEEETPDTTGDKMERGTSSQRRQLMFSYHRQVFHYPNGGAVGCSSEDEEEEEEKEYVPENKQDEDDDLKEMEEEDDPLMEAERLGFSTGFTCEPEEQEVGQIDFLLTYKSETVINSEHSGAAEAPGLRMRYKNLNKKN